MSDKRTTEDPNDSHARWLASQFVPADFFQSEQAKMASKTVSGLAALAGCSDRHVRRLVAEGEIKPGTKQAREWAFLSSRRKHFLIFRKAFLQAAESDSTEVRVSKMKIGDGPWEFGFDGITEDGKRILNAVPRLAGDPDMPNPELQEFAVAVSKNPPVLGVKRRRKQVTWQEVRAAFEDASAKRKRRPGLRAIAKELGVSHVALRKWFQPGGHLEAHSEDFWRLAGAAVVFYRIHDGGKDYEMLPEFQPRPGETD